MKKKRTTLLLCAIALLLVCAVGGTIAWLSDTTDTVTNTFTIGKVDIELTETFNTDSNNDNINDKWSAKLVPGVEYTKDPIVTVKANSEACYLFVKIDEINSPQNYLEYTSNLADWTKLADVDGVYFREVDTSDADQNWHLLIGDKVKVKTTLTSTTMPTAGNEPSIAYTAYAVQKTGVDSPADAWDIVND